MNRTPSSIDEKISPKETNQCRSIVDLILKKSLIKRLDNQYTLTLVSDEVKEMNFNFIMQEKFRLLDGAMINTRDIILGKSLIDDKGRKWTVRTINNSNGYFELENNTKILKGNYLQNNTDNKFKVYSLKTSNSDKEVKVYIPHTDSDISEKYKDMLTDILKDTPEGYFDYSKEVIFANAPSKLGFNINGTHSSLYNQICIYPSRSLKHNVEKVSQTFWHEQGHAYIASILSKYDFLARWQSAIASDGRFITEYAKTNTEEDFAETIAFYILYDAGIKNSKIRDQFKNRFEILDELFNMSPEIASQLKTYLRIKRGAQGAFVIGSGYAIYYVENRD